MKYLKTYKLFESIGFTESDIKDVFEPYINWDLIRDAQDMSLEYLDEGMKFNLEITYDDKYYIYYMRFSNDENFSEWKIGMMNDLTEGLYELEPIDKSKLIYQFYLTKDGLYNKSADEELESRIKEAYPNENVNDYSLRNVARSLDESIVMSESNSDIVEDVKDIIIDIADEGVEVNVKEHNDPYMSNRIGLQKVISVHIGNNIKPFDPKICIEPFMTLKSFLGEKGYSYFSGGTKYTTFESKIDSLSKGGNLLFLTILFAK